MPISTNAPFNEFGQSQILRDIEQLYLAMNAAGTGGAGDGQTQDQSSSNPVVPETEPIDLSQYATLDDLNNIPQVTYPISIANGGTGQTTQQAAIDALAGAVTIDLALVGNGTHVALGRVTRNTLSDGSACSVIGRSASSSGVVADISAGSNDLVFGRRSNALTWAKVAKAEMADASATSVIGRSANSTGVTADISGAANQVLACNSAPALVFSRTITLGDTSNAGSLTIGNTTSASAIVISPTLVTTAGKILSIREIDVCDAGVAKKMLVLASAPY